MGFLQSWMRWCPEGKVTEMLVYKSSGNWKNHKSLKWWNYQAIWSGAWAMCSVVSQKNLARKSQHCWLLPWILLQRRMQCAWRGQKIISCLVWSTFGLLAGSLLIWPCMERGKPTLHLVSQLIHSLVSQLQRATPLVNIQNVLLARSQSHPKNLPLWGGGGAGRGKRDGSFRNTFGFLQKCCMKGVVFFDCMFVLLFEKTLFILQFGEKRK